MNMLKFSEAVSLGLHAMAALAKDPETPRRNVELAERFGSSGNTLSKVLQRLTHAGMLEAVRGPAGGYRLAKAPSEIRLLDVYEALEGPLGKAGCLLGNPACNGRCILGGMVEEVHEKVRHYLTATTLADLAGSIEL